MKTGMDLTRNPSDIRNELEHDAVSKKNEKIRETEAFYKGYVEACEDFCRRLTQPEPEEDIYSF